MIRYFAEKNLTDKITSIEELDEFLRSNAYVNATADPTHTKYLYDAMLKKLYGFRQFAVNPWACTVLAYDRKYYHRVDLRHVFAGNYDLTFEPSRGQVSLGDILSIDSALGD